MLEAVSLSKRYNGTVALDGLDLTVEPGEVFCLLGANGAGKTTTINLFLSFVELSSGSARGQLEGEISPFAVSRESLVTSESLENPVRLHTGSFDLAFVLLYLGPLLILAPSSPTRLASAVE